MLPFIKRISRTQSKRSGNGADHEAMQIEHLCAVISGSKFFDREFYLSQVSRATLSGMDPVQHYACLGALAGLDPGPRFSTNAYLSANPDVAASGMNALVHYELYGRAEGRRLPRTDSRDLVKNINAMKIGVVGSCQSAGLANCLSLLLPGHQIEVRNGDADLSDLASTDVILLQSGTEAAFTDNKLNPAAKIIMWPLIIFTGFHPDIVYIDPTIESPTGGWHSSICLASWKFGLSVEATQSLFRKDVFEALGFFSHYEQAKAWLVWHLNQTGFPGESLVAKWCKSGCFMYGMNHPKLHVLADLSEVIVEKLGLEPQLRNPQEYIFDNMLMSASWSVYPPLSKALGLGPSQYRFKEQNPAGWRVGRVHDLASFIRASFEIYETYPQERLVADRLSQPGYMNLKSFVKIGPVVKGDGPLSPYSGLADYQFWRRAIERTPFGRVDPVVAGKFKLKKSDRVATAGSCFAQHISRTLESSGLNYYVAESAPPEMAREDGVAKNYGVFSARFGNLYTARQLLQLFDRAYNRFIPKDCAWTRHDGGWADPFRPTIEPEGFATAQDVEDARIEHFSAVRSMFETLDVFVFTLGLTEGWRSRIDGAVFPLAPGVVAGAMDDQNYEFINFGVAETAGDLNAFIERLRSVNRKSRIILTVSPVPLIATYEDRHVLVSTTYSKSVLRAAAEEVVLQNEDVAYFPSYEIITGAFNRGAYFEDDLRSVRAEGVEHVMSLFLSHYTDTTSIRPETAGSIVAREAEAGMHVVCDEVWMDI
ncbi:GSCFA domain-containing protein [Methylocystis rosea]|uniref:GSCFA domain-containing protein n=2 Tax=Methylocystis rosea TaxID=173366 RepID=A0ABX6EKW6_9HYPH|nr:GSCFA domain-containing protein [Methylocystis rosea]